MKLSGIVMLFFTIPTFALGQTCPNSRATASHDARGVNYVASLQERAPAKKANDIVDTAVAAESFKTLVKAVQAAELVDVLKSKGPFTVFAPSDEAFAKLPKETLADLLKPENREQLIAILKYHVVPGKVLSKDVANIESATTVNDLELPIKVDGDTVKIGNATVVKADIEAANGVIHVIDTVLIPKK